MEREVGGGIGMGNTCKPMAVSFQCMTKSTTIKKKKKLKKKDVYEFSTPNQRTFNLFNNVVTLLSTSDNLQKKNSRRKTVCILGPNCVQIFAASRTAARQAPLSRIFPRQEY